MKKLFLIALLAGLVASVKLNAQCNVNIVSMLRQGSSVVTFMADSISDRGMGLSGTPNLLWTFGDGSVATGQQITHQYSLLNGGTATYGVCLTMSDSLTGCNITTCDTIIVTGNPASNCSTFILAAQQDSVYTFSASNSGTPPYTYAWAINGQSAGVGAILSTVIVDSIAGTYTEVCVTVTDSAGCISSGCYDVSATQGQSNCNVYAGYTFADSVYTFYASGIGVGSGVYQWSYNNSIIGSADSVSLILDSAALNPNGALVCVSMTTANGCAATSCVSIGDSVATGGRNCQAFFEIVGDSLNGDTSGNYYGYNYSTGNYGSDILWSFGDGTSSTDPYPVHQYAQPGVYIVCLTIGVPGTSCYSTYCDSSFYVSRATILMHRLTILGPSGINQPGANRAVSVYPNPVSDELNITGQSGLEQVIIYNIEGQKVVDAKIAGSMIHVSKLSAGVYILELTSNGQVSRTKFVKD